VGNKTVLTTSTSRMSPWVIVRKRDWVSGVIPLAVREVWSLSGERARAVQVYSARRLAARQEPASVACGVGEGDCVGWGRFVVVDCCELEGGEVVV